jgi:ABC-2 type transport system permease protein
LNKFRMLLSARTKEFLRDREALGWNLMFPFLVIFGFAFMFSGGNDAVFKIAVHPDPKAAPAGATASFLETKHVQQVASPDLAAALEKLKRHQYDLVLSLEGSGKYWINASSPKGYLVERLLLASASARPPERGAVEGKEIRYVDWLISGLLAMNMMFSALFGVGYVIVRYRKIGVLRRLKAAPLNALTFLSAQIVSRYFLIMSATTIVYVGSNLLIEFQMIGSYLDLFVVLSLGAICLITLGLLVAARTASEEFAGGLLNLISWPMMFLSGVWFSLEGAHPYAKALAQIFPLTHVIDAARAIMTEGATLAAVSGHCLALTAMSAAFLVLGSLLFRWE